MQMFIDPTTMVTLTLVLTIENENRYIVDYKDIDKVFNIIRTNLEKENISLILLSRNYMDYSQNCFQKYDDKYYILFPWIDLDKLCKEFAGGISLQIINACYKDSLYQKLPPRNIEELQTLNKVYNEFVDKMEDENTEKCEYYNHRRKQIIKQKQKINRKQE